MDLTENDKKLVEHLFYDARRSTRELARIIGIKQPSVHARMKKLELEGFLSRYDSLITTHMFPFIHKVYYCSLCAAEVESVVAMPYCFILQEVYGQYTHQVSCFFQNEQQQIAFEKRLPKKRIEHVMTKSHLLGGTIFDVQREPEEYTHYEKRLSLDTLDVQLVKKMLNGGARKTITELAKELNTTCAIIKYRKKRLVDNGYFLVFLAQPGTAFKSIKVAYHVFFLEQDIDITRLAGLPRCIIAYAGDKCISVIQLSLSFDDYLEHSNALLRTLEPHTTRMQSFIVHKPIILNRLSEELFAEMPCRR